ncbi:MAG: ABC transporter, permease protein (cluster 3, basic aa/glutamine/opines), partial [uncultured Solirubrobacteraceae bacterium]
GVHRRTSPRADAPPTRARHPRPAVPAAGGARRGVRLGRRLAADRRGVLRRRGHAGALPGDPHRRAQEHGPLHHVRLRVRAGARARPRPHAPLHGPALPRAGHRVRRVLSRRPGPAGDHRVRLRDPRRAERRAARRRHRHHHGRARSRGGRLHGRDHARRHPGGAQGADGGGALARHVARPRDDLHRHPAGVPDHPPPADQRADPPDEGLVARVPARCDAADPRAGEVRARCPQPVRLDDADPRRRPGVPDHHRPAGRARTPPRGAAGGGAV